MADHTLPEEMSEERRTDNKQEGAPGPKRIPGWVLVVALLVVPGALYAAVPVVPFLPLTTAQKVGLTSGLIVVAEVIFWAAALFAGREVVSRYRRYFDPRTWFRKE